MTRRKSDLILPGETLINKPTFDADTSGAKRAQRVQAGESKLPCSSTPSLKTSGNTHTQGQQSLHPGCTAGASSRRAIAPRGAPLRSPAAKPGHRSTHAGRTARARGGEGGGTLPYLEQHKEPEQRQEAAAAAGSRGQVPHHGAEGTRGDRGACELPRRRLTMAN